MRNLGYASVFMTQFLRHPLRVGSVLPSSRSLARSMIPHVALRDAALVVELGPGTGEITREIVRRKPPGCTYLGVELNRKFLHVLEQRFPDATFYRGNANSLPSILSEFGCSEADVIVSSLPLTMLRRARAMSSIRAYAGCLSNGGTFATYIYCHNFLLRRNRELIGCLNATFSSLETERVIWNFPPALALRSRRSLASCQAPPAAAVGVCNA